MRVDEMRREILTGLTGLRIRGMKTAGLSKRV
jgi:hypothetical protein